MNAESDYRSRLRPWIIVSALLIFALLFVAYAYYNYEIERVLDEKGQDLVAIADIRMSNIQQFRKSMIADAWAMTIGPFFRHELTQWMRNHKDHALPKGMTERLVFRTQQAGYSDAILFDLEGNVITSATGQPSALSPLEKEAFDKAVASGQPQLSELYKDAKDIVSIDVVAPVKDSHGQAIAVALLRDNAESRLFPILRMWPTPSLSAETVLVRRDGDDALFLSNLLHKANAALSLREPLTTASFPAVQAVLGKQGMFRGRDYRGVEVLADLLPLPDSSWFMVTKIDESEIFSEVRYRGLIFAIFCGFLIITIVGASAYIFRVRQTRLYRDLYRLEREKREAGARYSSLFENMLEGLAHCQMIIEDGIPLDFVYLDVNEAFSRLTGLKDVAGKRGTEVLPGINETNPELIGLYGRVAATGKPERLETYIESLDRWFSISVYCPDQGYFVVVFDNITERKKIEESLQKSEALFRAVFEQAGVGVAQIESLTGKFVRVNQRYCDIVGYTRKEMEHLTFQNITHPDDLQADLANMNLFLSGKIREFSMEKRYFHKDGSVIWVNLSVSPLWHPGEAPNFHIAVVEDITARKLAENALRESETEKSMILESAAEMFVYYDLDLRVRWMNRAARATVGPEIDSAIGLNCHEIWHGSQQPCQDCPVARCRATGLPQETETTTPDGKMCFLRVYPVRNDYGELVGLLEFIQDITDQKKARRALEESERRFRATFDTALVGIDIVDRDGGFLEVNSALSKTLGYDLDELRLMTIFDVTHTEDIDSSREMHEALVTGQTEEYRSEKRYIRKDGRTIWADTAVSALRGPEGEYLATIGVIRDITRLKRSQEAQGRLAAAVGQAVETVVITDLQGTIEYVNPSFEKVTGYSSDEAIGQNPRILKSGRQDQGFYQNLWETIKAGHTWTGHFVNRKKDGTLFEEDASISPVRDDSGRITNFVAVKRDVSLEMSLQRQLQQSQKMEAIGILSGGIAHDFNNILQIVLGFSEILLWEKDLAESYKNEIRMISESARQGAELVKGLMAFGRRAEFKPQPLNMNHRILDLRKMLERTIPKTIDIDLLLAEDLASVNADPTHVDQILMNLAVNARDAMPQGGKLTFSTSNIILDDEYVSTHIDAKPGPHVLLTVSDTGCGMDSGTIERIFEPFYTTKEKGKGTGLGLAMVHGIVNQHGGHITCNSQPGMGSAFRIYLPANVPDYRENGMVVGTMPRGGIETILVVDDEEMIRKLSVRILTRAGYKVIEASNGKEAVRLYKERNNEIDLILLDLMMPEMDGMRCMEAMLAIDPSVKVVVASGYVADEFIHSALTAGAKAAIQKPYDIQKALSTIREVLDSSDC